ncbi:L-ascorbate oxidase [Crucibulum laeve]|uniref:Peroxidase n=1 Tax=Crucibulum laeve TaxID=68775 RepID=A0A5C3MA15_9AGAR|nr:L-ascorbate oxidase [Crucibulum laeve]
MNHNLKLALVLCLSVFTDLSFGYRWPSPQYDALEGYLYEGRRADGTSLAALVHPCRKRTGTLASIPAEWLRIAFHDMATHNVDDGTGGLDGSIAYELDRGENFGSGFNQTLSDFETFPNKYVSRADVIALGAVLAVSTCGGPIIPYRGGRVDVYTAGPTGVPEPQQDINTHTEMFRKQGFSQSEMIKLVACGHSFGGVRNTDFPQLVPADPSKSVNIKNFDTTDNFDNVVVTQYLDGSTQNVLVVSDNKTMVSDLRVFASDGNSTMHSLASADTYNTECTSVLERMINTVAHGVTLTDEITLLPAKVTLAQLTIEQSKLVFKSSLRLTNPINGTINKNRTVRMLWCDRNGDSQDCKGNTRYAQSVNTVTESPDLSPVTLKLGLFFINYQFIVPIDSTASISKFWFEVDEHDGSKVTVYNNEGDNYVVDQDQVIFIPTMSKAEFRSNSTEAKVYTNRNSETFTKVYTFTAAVRDGVNPSRVYIDAQDDAFGDFLQPFNSTIDLTLNSTAGTVQGYKLYTGTVKDVGFQLMIDVHADTDGTTHTVNVPEVSNLDNTVLTAPATPSSQTSSGSSSSSSSSSWRSVPWTSVSLALIFGFTTLLLS